MTAEKAISELEFILVGHPETSARGQAVLMAMEALKEEPRKTARWIPLQDGYFFKRRPHKCSACGNILEFEGVNAGRGDANYCPNCGAYMETDK